jgi:hypothetical protein
MDSYDRCPFCHIGEGEVEEVSAEGIMPIAYAVVCEECGAFGPPATTLEGAVACWRSRTALKESAVAQ